MICQIDIIWTASMLLTGASLALIWRLVSNTIKTKKIQRQMENQSIQRLMKYLQDREDHYE